MRASIEVVGICLTTTMLVTMAATATAQHSSNGTPGYGPKPELPAPKRELIEAAATP